MRSLLMVLVLLLVVGCGSGEGKKTPVPFDQVPEKVLEGAKKKYPNVKFERAMKEANGDYELIGKEDKTGRTVEADFTPKGDFVRED